MSAFLDYPIVAKKDSSLLLGYEGNKNSLQRLSFRVLARAIKGPFQHLSY